MSTVSSTSSLFTTASAATSAGSAAGAASTSAAQQEQSQFLQLLVTQLKDQNPLDPQDGTQFVTQLAQFSSLEELVNIRTILQSNAGTTAGPTSTTNPTTPINPTSPATISSTQGTTNSTQGA
jgi:flagellar hook assembly protein FlgD